MVLGGMKIPYGLSHKTLKRLCLTIEDFSNLLLFMKEALKSVVYFFLPRKENNFLLVIR
jgi:hypothetical protein